jgi:hypothetical protein
MRREYTMRGQLLSVEELEDVVAVKLRADAPLVEDELVRAFGATTDALPGAADDTQRSAFVAAGWRFVIPTPAIRLAITARSDVAGAEAVQRVFVRPNGRVLLGTDRLSVRLRDDMSEAQALGAIASAGLDVVNRLRFAPNLYEVRVRPGADFLDVSMRLSEDASFLYAEPQFIEHIPGRFTPTDPDYGDQWHLNNTGQGGGTAGADISAEDAWDITRGAGVRLCVIDNGIEVTHDDLTAAVVAGSGFFQMDGMGNTNFIQGLIGFPTGNHGTFCSGMAIARANNGENGCGVANEADFLAVACLGDQVGTQATLARAVAYAADPTQEVPGANPADGADVISSSLGPNGADWDMTQTMQDAIDFAVTNGRGGLGTPIFWAVSNGDFDIVLDEVTSYANVIAVGRSTRDDLEDGSAHGEELEFLAPGVDVSSTESGNGFGTSTGTSFAAPTAAGIGALALAVNPDLTWQQVRQAMIDSCDKVGGVVYDGNGFNNDYGFGRVNAAAALCEAAFLVTLDTPSVVFNDVPEGETTARAVVFTVVTCGTATFQIIAGPTVTSGPGSFGTLPSLTSSLPATSALEIRQARLWLSFTGQNDGDLTNGEVTVRLVETGDEFVVPISANTIERPTVGVVLALDQSGSMTFASGLTAFATRGDVLKFAAPVFVNLFQEDNGIGIVAFDHDAYNRMNVQTVGPVSAFDPVRATALGVLAAYAPNPAGNTSIGDALEESQAKLAAGPVYDYKAIVVFTDGFETAPKYIPDVAPGVINERVFAIGLGTADQVKPSALVELTNGTGGYLLLTGAIGPEDLFRLSKYYLQILAGVTNHDIVLDPEGTIRPGQKHRIPFYLNEADIAIDGILLGETNLPLFKWVLETPAGDVIDPGVATGIAGGSYVQAQGVSFYRLTLPVPIGAVGARAGKWHAILTVDEVYYKRYLAKLDNYPELYKKVLAHGVQYSLSVHSYSGIRLLGQVTQTSNEPGATLTVRGVLTEYGVPVPGTRATVKAEYTRPDGTGGVLGLVEDGAETGSYVASLLAGQAGVYRFRLLANGKSMRGREFTREHLLTGAVWKGGDQPPPSSDPGGGGDGGGKDDWCQLLECLLSQEVIRPDMEMRLREFGLDLGALRACIKEWCQQDRPTVAIPVRPPDTIVIDPRKPVAVPGGSQGTLTRLVDAVRQLVNESQQR